MQKEIIIKYSSQNGNLIKCHRMILDLSGKSYQLVKIGQDNVDFYLMTGSGSGTKS